MGLDRVSVMIDRLTWPPTIQLKKEPLLWITAGVLSLAFFLLVTFPYRALQSRILTEITQRTGWDVRAADWSVGLPLAIEWRDLVFSKAGAATIPVESMRVGIGLLPQLFGQQKIEGTVQFPGSSQAGNGRLSATVIASKTNFQGVNDLKGRIQQVDLAQLVKPYVTKGLLQADMQQRWLGTESGGMAFKGDGTWKAEVRDLLIERIPVGQAAIPSLAFNRVTLSLVCHDATCDVTEGKGDGPDGSVAVQGQLKLQYPIQQSTLELALTVQAGPGWAQKAAGLPFPPLPPGVPLTFKLVGPVANPRLSV